MQTRPGAKPPIGENEIPGVDINSPRNVTINDIGVQEAEDISMAYASISWDRPLGYVPQYYIIQMQVTGGDWSEYQEFGARKTSQKIVFSQGVNYEIRVTGISKVNKVGSFSSVVQISEVANDNTPATPTFDDVNCYFEDVIYLKWLDNNNKLPTIYEVREDLSWGDGNHLYQGKNTNILVDDLNDLSNPSIPTQTFYVKSLSYNDVYSTNYDSVTIINAVPGEATGLVINSSLSQIHITMDIPEIRDLDYVEYQIHDSSNYSGNYSIYKRKEVEVSVPIKIDGTNYCRVRFVDILGQSSNWVNGNTTANLITREDMQGALFQIQPSSNINLSAGNLENLWNGDTSTGASFSPVSGNVVITFEFPMQWFFSMVRFYTETAENYYVEVYSDSTGSWTEVLGASITPKSSNASSWTIEKFEGLTDGKMYVSRKARITFVNPSSFTIDELKFWTVTLADEILAQTMQLTGNMKIETTDGLTYIDSQKIYTENANGDHSELTAGLLAFYKNGYTTPHWYSKRVAYGIAQDGDYIDLAAETGVPWDKAPKVQTAIKSLMSYNSSYNGSNQFFESYADGIDANGFYVYGKSIIQAAPLTHQVDALAGDISTGYSTNTNVTKLYIYLSEGWANFSTGPWYVNIYYTPYGGSEVHYGRFYRYGANYNAFPWSFTISGLSPNQYSVRVYVESGSYDCEAYFDYWREYADEIVDNGTIMWIAVEGGAD